MGPKKTFPHPSIEYVLGDIGDDVLAGDDRSWTFVREHATSPSLARALAVGGLSRLDPALSDVNIWDPAAGSGFAGSVLVSALESVGVQTRYRGQDIHESAVAASTNRFEAYSGAEIAHGNTLIYDAYPDFVADLVIVDAPWGMSWSPSAQAVKTRHSEGAFSFGLPQHSDSTWLFISLALEKLRRPERGGGRVAALVNPGALSASGSSGAVRQQIVEAGLLESVTRLPDGLALGTRIPLYLLTFSNSDSDVVRGKTMVADLQTAFSTEHHQRQIAVSGLSELESGLRTRKPGPRNRLMGTRQFTRRDARLSRTTEDGHELSWRVTSHNDCQIDRRFLEARYGPESGVLVLAEPQEVLDLDPSRLFGDDSRDLLKDFEEKGWTARRLSSLIAREPEKFEDAGDESQDKMLYVPTGLQGRVTAEAADIGSASRVLAIQLENQSVEPSFLAGWLNSEQGTASRRRAIEASSSGATFKALGSDAGSLMRWADELIVPVPDRGTQLSLASVDLRLAAFEAELDAARENVFASPESAEAMVSRLAGAFDDSLSTWLDELPYPVASALWTAETASTPGERQRAYIHAWEAIVTFHATVLLSASRNDPGGSTEVEAAIRQTLQEQRLGIERASFGTWVIIIERLSKEFRRALEEGDADDIARVRRAFGDLSQSGIARLVSIDLVKKVKDVNLKRNRWLGHAGYTSAEDWQAQVDSLVSNLSDLRQILGNVWAQLTLVRAGTATRARNGLSQTGEVAVGTRVPFKSKDFRVGDLMINGDLYLVKDGSQSPLRLGHFVQLRPAPRSTQYTTYFYNRTDGPNVRMVSYQYGPESEVQDDTERFRDEFGGLMLE